MLFLSSLQCSLSGGSELKLGLHHSLDTGVHILDKVLLGATETSAVGDVENSIAGVGVLTVRATDLDSKLIGNTLESGHVLHEVGESDVDGSTESSSEVGWARGDVTDVVVVGETSTGLDGSGGSGETLEDGGDVGTWLHGDDTELILLVDPDKESLVVVVEDSTTVWPVAVESTSLKETISLSVEIKANLSQRYL